MNSGSRVNTFLVVEGARIVSSFNSSQMEFGKKMG